MMTLVFCTKNYKTIGKEKPLGSVNLKQTARSLLPDWGVAVRLAKWGGKTE